MPDVPILITAAQCRAGRALLEWTQIELAQAAGVELETVEHLEARFRRPNAEGQSRIRKALEDGGILFIADDDGGGGVGARLKFSRKEVRAINRWEQEGGTPGEDDIW